MLKARNARHARIARTARIAIASKMCRHRGSALTFVISDKTGPVAQVLVTFDNLLVPVIVTLEK